MKSKRAFIATVLSAMLITAAFPIAASAAGNEVLLGDVNGNGKVEVTDATMVQMIAAELTTVSAERMKAADVNGDGEVNIADVNCLIDVILGVRTADEFEGRALVNDDDEVNIADVNAVIDIILGF